MKLRIGFILVCLLGVLGACQDEENVMKPAEKVSRTVLAYMVSDDNSSAADLSSLIKGNFNDMVKGMASVDDSDCNMLVYSKLTGSNPCLIRLEKVNGKVVPDTLLTYKEENPLDKEVMIDVLSNAFTLFPADSYGFVFLSHAEGWIPATTKASRSIGLYRNTSMDIDEFREVLSTVGQHLDFILFDACFMQSVEVAYELRNHVDYFIGSPTEIPGPGAPYDKLTPFLFSEGDVAINIAKSYFGAYADKYTGRVPPSNANWTGGVSVSVIKASALDNLAASTAQIISKYGKNVSAFDIMCYDRRSTKCYYDLDGLIHGLTQGNSDYVAWRENFMEARPYWETTLKNYSGSDGMFSMDGAEGVSTYIPSGKETSTRNTYYRTYQWSTTTRWGN